MKSNKIKKSKFEITKYLPVFIILIALTILIGSTLAYFTDREDEEETLTFGKVELSSATNPGVSGVIRDAIPGTELVKGKIEFSKSIDSAPIYVRAKISFTLVNQNNTAMIPYLEALRNAEEIGLITTTQNGNAVWSAKEGNYYYLLDSADTTKLKIVDTIDTYVLTNSFIVPRDLEQLPDMAQYMESVRFNLAFEAIQADNVSTDMAEVKELFNQTFPESAAEKIEIVNNVTKPITEEEWNLALAFNVEDLLYTMTTADMVLSRKLDGNKIYTRQTGPGEVTVDRYYDTDGTNYYRYEQVESVWTATSIDQARYESEAMVNMAMFLYDDFQYNEQTGKYEADSCGVPGVTNISILFEDGKVIEIVYDMNSETATCSFSYEEVTVDIPSV